MQSLGGFNAQRRDAFRACRQISRDRVDIGGLSPCREVDYPWWPKQGDIVLGAKGFTFSLLRVGSVIHASNVEAKLGQRVRADGLKFDPNQPRVPAGNPDGGQWTDAGGEGAGSAQGSESAVGSRQSAARSRLMCRGL
jgi:hypothetical protein